MSTFGKVALVIVILAVVVVAIVAIMIFFAMRDERRHEEMLRDIRTDYFDAEEE